MSKQGIKYYSMDVDHIRDVAVKLLHNEFGPDGYWIWKCLLSSAYEEFGYYLPVGDKDWLTLFASDVCKLRVSLVEEVIKGCVRRGLFDKSVFDTFQVLTSKRMQENFLDATDRRKDPREMYVEYTLINPDVYKNIESVNISGKNVSKIPKKDDSIEQRKGKERKGKYIPPTAEQMPAHLKTEKEWYRQQVNENLKGEYVAQYRVMLNHLFGTNEAKRIYKNILSMRDQITYAEFVTMEKTSLETSISSVEIFDEMENYADLPYKNLSVSATAINWMRRNIKKLKVA